MRTPPRILIVDDNPVNVDILKTRLAALNYEVATAGDGAAALSLVKELHPDLVLLDVMMPKVDGLEVCRQLKSDPSLPFTPVIMSASALQCRRGKLFFAVFVGRLVRFTIEALLALYFGKQVLRLMDSPVVDYVVYALVAIGAVASVLSLVKWLKRNKKEEKSTPPDKPVAAKAAGA